MQLNKGNGTPSKKIITVLFKKAKVPFSLVLSRIFYLKQNIMKTFFSPTSMNNKYEIKSYVEITEAGKNFGGNNVVEYKGTPYFNMPFHYWVNKKTLDIVVEKYNALKTYM